MKKAEMSVTNQEVKTARQKKDDFENIVRNYLESNPVVSMNRKTNE